MPLTRPKVCEGNAAGEPWVIPGRDADLRIGLAAKTLLWFGVRPFGEMEPLPQFSERRDLKVLKALGVAAAVADRHRLFFLGPYGLLFVGFNEMFSSLALDLTASSDRPRPQAMRPVGLLPFASWRSF